jgi:hypothetical protein
MLVFTCLPFNHATITITIIITITITITIIVFITTNRRLLSLERHDASNDSHHNAEAAKRLTMRVHPYAERAGGGGDGSTRGLDEQMTQAQEEAREWKGGVWPAVKGCTCDD